jgi:hypothetical protein
MPKSSFDHKAPHCLAGKNRYCGPAVVAMLIGVDTDEAARRIRQATGLQAVKGTYPGELAKTLAASGLTMTRLRISGVSSVAKDSITLAGWARCEARDKTAATTYLVLAGHHWLVTRGRQYFCGQVRQWIPLTQAPHRRARVSAVFAITGKMATSYPTIGEAEAKVAAKAAAKATRKPSKPRKPSLTLAQRAAQWGIEVEKMGTWDGYNVWPPEVIGDDEESDPSYGDHFCDDAHYAKKLVDTYIALLQQMGYTEGQLA